MFRKTDLLPALWGRLWGRRYGRSLFALIAAISVGVALEWFAAPLSAHGGGVPRLTDEVAGPYRLFAWTQPEPLRVGDIHLSLAVVKGERSGDQATSLDEPITDATVKITLQPLTPANEPLQIVAVPQQQLGSYYYEADATLPTAGDWRFTIEVSGALGVGSASFVGQVAAARQLNWTLIVTAALLLAGLLALIGLWNRLQAKAATPTHGR